MPSTTTTLLSFSTVVLSILLAYALKNPVTNEYFPPNRDCSTYHSGYFEYECAGKPHQSSWQSWFHPQRLFHSSSSLGTSTTGVKQGQGGGAVTKDWNILYHLGGNGPWVEKVEGVVEGGIAVPKGCDVEMVHMVRCSRRGAYFSKREY